VKFENSIEIAKPQEVVYAIVRDLERAPEWQPSLESVDVQAGTEVRSVAGKRQTLKFFVLEDDPPRRLVMSSEGGPAKARATFDLDRGDDGDGTQVKFSLDIELRGAARFAGPLVKSTAQNEVRTTLEKLKEFAER
jgi:carbon monoxide dehydrogenase subunit G